MHRFLSLVVSSRAAIVPVLCWKYVEHQHPWQNALVSDVLGCVLRDARAVLARNAPIRHHTSG